MGRVYCFKQLGKLMRWSGWTHLNLSGHGSLQRARGNFLERPDQNCRLAMSIGLGNNTNSLFAVSETHQSFAGASQKYLEVQMLFKSGGAETKKTVSRSSVSGQSHRQSEELGLLKPISVARFD
ncbi:hypothetical protein [Ruegeria sp. Ofav3-42]|uniref:hypothetical protein n=1 Tax=Ruegeria sp. Ofav3-42 TaxID=2917759 RepID=UPI001EF45650|nr:hypothetical protein [Ruegeria sp. Ofav3-42]MCG7521517.1 hypothetical protein [Ruegeria sp. Ofav3-42]